MVEIGFLSLPCKFLPINSKQSVNTAKNVWTGFSLLNLLLKFYWLCQVPTLSLAPCNIPNYSSCKCPLLWANVGSNVFLKSPKLTVGWLLKTSRCSVLLCLVMCDLISLFPSLQIFNFWKNTFSNCKNVESRARLNITCHCKIFIQFCR